MSNKSLIDDYTAVLFSPSSYFTSPVHNYTERHTWAFSFFLFFFFPPYFPHLSSCLISWSFPAPSHLDKSWNIKQTHTSGLVMLTSVARVCVRPHAHVCVRARARVLSGVMLRWLIAARIESITVSQHTIGTGAHKHTRAQRTHDASMLG